MGTRRKSRELALQMLFQADMGGQGADHVRRTFWAERNQVGADVRGFADELFRTATDRNADIDALIERHAQHWRMERMAAVDRNILRAAVAEFLGCPQTPRAVVINEAIAHMWFEVAMGRETVPRNDEALRMLVKKYTTHGRPAS